MGARLYIAGDTHTANGAIPTLTEGPLDAIAITLATGGTHLGVAPLGTSLTEEQAAHLAALADAVGHQPIVATDGDLAGRLAAERDYWLLTQHGLDPTHAALPDGHDLASLLTEQGAVDVAALLYHATPLADTMLRACTGRNDDLPRASVDFQDERAQVIAARPPDTWTDAIVTHAVDDTDHRFLWAAVADSADRMNRDRHRFAGDCLMRTAHVRARFESSDDAPPSAGGRPWLAASIPDFWTSPTGPPPLGFSTTSPPRATTWTGSSAPAFLRNRSDRSQRETYVIAWSATFPNDSRAPISRWTVRR